MRPALNSALRIGERGASERPPRHATINPLPSHSPSGPLGTNGQALLPPGARLPLENRPEAKDLLPSLPAPDPALTRPRELMPPQGRGQGGQRENAEGARTLWELMAGFPLLLQLLLLLLLLLLGFLGKKPSGETPLGVDTLWGETPLGALSGEAFRGEALWEGTLWEGMERRKQKKEEEERNSSRSFITWRRPRPRPRPTRCRPRSGRPGTACTRL